MARSVILILALITALVAGLLIAAGSAPIRAVQAQESSPTTETLMEFTLDDSEVPPRMAAIRLLRITLEPGAKSPLHTHPGPEFNLVESGTLRALVQGKALWNERGNQGTPAAAPGQPPDGEFIVRRGGSIAYMPGTALTFRNTGSSDATILAAVIQPFGNQAPPGFVWVGQAPSADETAGLISTILGDGVTPALPDGQVIFRVERMTLSPGEPIPPTSVPTLLSLDVGALDFIVQSPGVQVTRTDDAGARPEAATGTAFSLEPGDAAFFPDGVAEAPRSDEEGELVLLRLTISPVEPPTSATPVAGGPGVIEITTPPTPSPTPEPTATPTPEASPTPEEAEIVEGATVVVTEDDVRLRGGPSTDTEIVGAVSAGQVLLVTGPSQEGNDYIWWPVQDPNNPAVVGFIAEDFIEVQE